MNQEKRRIKTKNSILRAAVECFAEYGFEATDVNKICKKVGLTKGAFYHHFTSKQDLFLELLDGWINKIGGHLKPSDINPKNTLETLTNIAEKIRNSIAHPEGKESGLLPIKREELLPFIQWAEELQTQLHNHVQS